MKFLFSFLLATQVFADAKVESFVIQIKDRSFHVQAPERKKQFFPVIVENLSLSDQLGKFTVKGKLLKYVTVKPGKSETVEIENKSSENVMYVPVSPAFQEVELIFGKKAYEVPSKE